jgi:hypothetical protein
MTLSATATADGSAASGTAAASVVTAFSFIPVAGAFLLWCNHKGARHVVAVIFRHALADRD